MAAAVCTSSSEEIESFGIHKTFVISCPLCRKEFSYQDDVSSLPNNSYALHMLKLTATKGTDEVTVKPNSQEKPAAWCLTCRKVANKPNCSTHSAVEVSANTIKNFESFMKLKEDLKNLMAEGETKLSLAIEKRKEVQAHLHQVSQCLKLVLHEVNQQEEQNNTLLCEMISQLEPSNKVSDEKPISPSTEVKEEDPHLSQLVSLINESKPEKRKNLEVLKEKMKKSLQLCESKLADAVALAKAVQFQKKCKISVRLADSKKQPIPTWGLLESGFDTYWPYDNSLTPTKRDFLLLSHIVFSIQKRGMKIRSKK
ncbi:hypothetical protein DAPPUDRAFT_241450 [Daphnia pulex]|uniref:Uncharacterized protein n=1 Tax=Daphnia pulex TaxID=6669 RepID=E9GEA2_DAPPU|nr:hypothetical protein DAPPUDRAFT_241450 [Daphnia pulex]|eukprot:EFX82229.1 hypothetical protein DAPPUDRAFT_241450 [Daphnia pulex]